MPERPSLIERTRRESGTLFVGRPNPADEIPEMPDDPYDVSYDDSGEKMSPAMQKELYPQMQKEFPRQEQNKPPAETIQPARQNGSDKDDESGLGSAAAVAEAKIQAAAGDRFAQYRLSAAGFGDAAEEAKREMELYGSQGLFDTLNNMTNAERKEYTEDLLKNSSKSTTESAATKDAPKTPADDRPTGAPDPDAQIRGVMSGGSALVSPKSAKAATSVLESTPIPKDDDDEKVDRPPVHDSDENVSNEE